MFTLSQLNDVHCHTHSKSCSLSFLVVCIPDPDLQFTLNATLRKHTHSISMIAIHPNGHTLLSGGKSCGWLIRPSRRLGYMELWAPGGGAGTQT